MSDHSRPIVAAFEPRSSLMTPAQHRRWAEILRAEPELDPDSADLADAHDQIARALELRRSKAS